MAHSGGNYGSARDESRRLSASGHHALHHQVSSISDVSDIGLGQDVAGHIRGRPSLVSLPSMQSLQSSNDPQHPVAAPAAFQGSPGFLEQQNQPASYSHPRTTLPPVQTFATRMPPSTYSYSDWAGTESFATHIDGGSGSYSPLGPTNPQCQAPASSAPLPSRSFGRGKSLRMRQDAIPEEGDGIDMSTMRSRHSPLGLGPSSPYTPVSRHDPEAPPESEMEPEPVYEDLSTVGGHLTWTPLDTETSHLFQQQEASGHLTGGLGEGFRTNATIREAELLAASPAGPELQDKSQGKRKSMVARRATVKALLTRRPTVKALGQSEANRRGEIIEVIMDEPPLPPLPGPAPGDTFDLSEMGGPLGDKGGDFGMRQATFPQRQQSTQVFYPQPNWKPFVMRPWYLAILIVISVVLAISQEALYRKSAQEPLLTFRRPDEIPRALYFALKFAPTMISVTYGVLWSMTDFEVRRLEAFYQLSKDDGASAGQSINVDYLTFYSFLRPFRAMRCNHFAVFISSTASLLAVSLVPTLLSASIMLFPDRHTRLENPLGNKWITINAVWSRILTTMLFLIAALGCVLFWHLQTRKSGLLSDVKGIAGLASMATVSHILMDFKDMDLATHQDIHQKLKKRRYVLRNSSLAPDDNNKSPSDKERAPTGDLEKDNNLSTNPHPLMLRAAGAGPLVGGIVLFIILVQLVLFTEATALTDQAPWVITALTVIIKMGWSGMDTDLRMMEPYYILWKRHAPARTLTLDYTAMPFGWVAIRGAMNRHFLIFFVGLGTVMSEVLTVLATSLATVSGRDFLDVSSGLSPDAGEQGKATDLGRISSGQETVVSFWITYVATAFILVYMAAVATAVLVLRRRPFLPRQPNTIASVLAFIHQSKMLYDFVGTSKLGARAMARRLEEGGKTYGVGWFQGRDGLTHCGVDQEELSSGYKPGYDYSKATNPWLSSQEWM